MEREQIASLHIIFTINFTLLMLLVLSNIIYVSHCSIHCLIINHKDHAQNPTSDNCTGQALGQGQVL